MHHLIWEVEAAKAGWLVDIDGKLPWCCRAFGWGEWIRFRGQAIWFRTGQGLGRCVV
jgi:hypothetical protein